MGSPAGTWYSLASSECAHKSILTPLAALSRILGLWVSYFIVGTFL